MYETDEQIAELQAILDRSFQRLGPHAAVIITPERRLTARQVVKYLVGMKHIVVGTVTSRDEPRVAPVDGHFLRGRFWFGILKSWRAGVGPSPSASAQSRWREESQVVPWTVEYDSELGIVDGRYVGRVTDDDFKEATAKAIALAKANNTNRFLIDDSEWEGSASVLGLFELPEIHKELEAVRISRTAEVRNAQFYDNVNDNRMGRKESS